MNKVKINNLYLYQKLIPQVIEKKRENRPIKVEKYDNLGFLVRNGNHRVFKAMNEKQTEIEVEILSNPFTKHSLFKSQTVEILPAKEWYKREKARLISTKEP